MRQPGFPAQGLEGLVSVAAGHLVVNPAIKNWGPGGFLPAVFTSSQLSQARREGQVAFNLPTHGLALQCGVDPAERFCLGERVLVSRRWPRDAAPLGAYTLLIARPSFEPRQSRVASKATFSLLSLEGDDSWEVTTAFCRGLGGTAAA